MKKWMAAVVLVLLTFGTLVFCWDAWTHESSVTLEPPNRSGTDSLIGGIAAGDGAVGKHIDVESSSRVRDGLLLKIRTADGAGIAGACVAPRWSRERRRIVSAEHVLAVSDANGEAAIAIRPETAQGVLIAHSDYLSVEIPGERLADRSVVTVTMRPGARLHLTARTRAGLPLRDVFVAVSNCAIPDEVAASLYESTGTGASRYSPVPTGGKIAFGRTDRLGEVVLRGLLPGRFMMNVLHETHVVVNYDFGVMELPASGAIVMARPIVALAELENPLTWWRANVPERFTENAAAQRAIRGALAFLRAKYPGRICIVGLIDERSDRLRLEDRLAIQCLGRHGWQTLRVPLRPFHRDMTPLPMKLSKPKTGEGRSVGLVRVILEGVDSSPWSPKGRHPYVVMPMFTERPMDELIDVNLERPMYLLAGDYSLFSVHPHARAALPKDAKFVVKPGIDTVQDRRITLRAALRPLRLDVRDALGIPIQRGYVRVRHELGGTMEFHFDNNLHALRHSIETAPPAKRIRRDLSTRARRGPSQCGATGGRSEAERS